jgi:hypothetical protein
MIHLRYHQVGVSPTGYRPPSSLKAAQTKGYQVLSSMMMKPAKEELLGVH